MVDALTVDGRHVDPFTGLAPHWDLDAGSLKLTQIWCDYFNRIQLPNHAGDRDALKEYLLRFPERTGRPEDAILSGDVYWVKTRTPRMRETKPRSQERTLVFSLGGTAPPEAPSEAPSEDPVHAPELSPELSPE